MGVIDASGCDLSELYVASGGVEFIDVHPTDEVISIRFEDGVSGCTLFKDGRLEMTGNYTPSEAAKAFWQAVALWLPADVKLVDPEAS